MQQLIQATSSTYYLVLFLAAAIAVYRISTADTATRAICCWIWLGLTTELTAMLWASEHKGNNMPVYTLSSFVELIIFSCYFHFSQPYLKRKRIAIFAAILGSTLGILNTLFLQELRQSNSNFVFLECLIISSMSLYALYRMLLTDNIRLSKQTHYWTVLTLLFYQCGSLWNWGFYNFAVTQSLEAVMVLNLVFLTVNIITYGSFATILFRYPKMKSNYV